MGISKIQRGATLAEDDDGGGGVNFSVTAQIGAGDYEIWVKGYSPSVSGSYVLRVDFTAGGRSPPLPGDDHGNTRSTATSVAAPSSTAGTLTAGDVDYFTVTVSQPGTLTVNTSGSTDTYGTLEDASGGTLATNDDGGSGTNFRLSSAVSAGTYYVQSKGLFGQYHRGLPSSCDVYRGRRSRQYAVDGDERGGAIVDGGNADGR